MVGLNDPLINKLKLICPNRVHQEVDLSKISRWKVGGLADLIIEPASISELTSVIELFNELSIKTLTIGNTTNLLFSDKGLRIPCIKIGTAFGAIKIKNQIIHGEPGIWIPKLARKAMENGLSGLEHVSGIPGTLGGLTYMNGGSLRNSLSTSIVEVQSIDMKGKLFRRSNEDCLFEYRKSIFHKLDEIIVSVSLALEKVEKETIKASMREILANRRKKFPKNKANCGSVFKSDPYLYKEYGPPGRVIEDLGLKGRKIGGAKISFDHANFIVNEGNASARDIISLVFLINKLTKERFGFTMTPEVKYVSELGEVVDILTTTSFENSLPNG